MLEAKGRGLPHWMPRRDFFSCGQNFLITIPENQTIKRATTRFAAVRQGRVLHRVENASTIDDGLPSAGVQVAGEPSDEHRRPRTSEADLFPGWSKMELLNLTCIVCISSFEAARPQQGRYPRFLLAGVSSRSRSRANTAPTAPEGRYPTRTEPAKRRLIAKVCVVCDDPFETTSRQTRCCGRTCGQALAAPAERCYANSPRCREK